MPAYCWFNVVRVRDEAAMERYRAEVFETVREFGGRYVVLGGSYRVMEGSPKVDYPVVIEFPSMARALEWYGSERYAPLLAIRRAAGEFDAVFVEGAASV